MDDWFKKRDGDRRAGIKAYSGCMRCNTAYITKWTGSDLRHRKFKTMFVQNANLHLQTFVLKC